MRIRLASLKDKKQILKLLDELIAEVNKRNKKPIKYSKGDEARGIVYDEEIKRDDIKIFVVEEGKRLVGVAELFIVPILRRGYHQGVIESLVVSESMRGKGIGSKLLQEIFRYCKQQGIKVVKLTSSIYLTDAHKFYKKHGGKFTEKLFRFEL